MGWFLCWWVGFSCFGSWSVVVGCIFSLDVIFLFCCCMLEDLSCFLGIFLFFCVFVCLVRFGLFGLLGFFLLDLDVW